MKKVVIILSLLVVACGGYGGRDEEAYAEAQRLFNDGKYKEAVERYQAFIEDYPKSKFITEAKEDLEVAERKIPEEIVQFDAGFKLVCKCCGAVIDEDIFKIKDKRKNAPLYSVREIKDLNCTKCANYFPLNEGDWWEYRAKPGNTFSKREVGKIFLWGGERLRECHDTGNLFGTIYFKIEGYGYVRLWQGTAYGPEPSVKKFQMHPKSDPGWTEEGELSTVRTSCEGIEPVVVPAGAFINCFKFKITETPKFGYEKEIITYYWLAPDVGIVKEEFYPLFGGEGKLTRELVGFKVGSFTPAELRDINDKIVESRNRVSTGESNKTLPTKLAIVDKEGCELRTAPSIDAEFIEMVPYNAECKVLDRHEGWFKIRAPSGSVGWLSGYGEITGNVYVGEIY